MTFTRLLVGFLVFTGALSYGAGQEEADSQLPFNPQDGETVVFLGDSITHQCLYTQYLENFFITRFPERRLHFRNAGISGNKAAQALERFEWDVATFEPDYVTVLLGMNDGRYEGMNPDTFAVYEQDMKALFDRLDEIGAKTLVLSPTMFDHHVTEIRKDDKEWRFQEKEFSPNYNALMAFYGGWCLEEGGRRGYPFVSIWSPLNRHAIAQRRSNPDFNMIWDAIHPNASGQFVMVFETVSQLGTERKGASTISIGRRGGKWKGSKGVEDLRVMAGEDGNTSMVEFSHLATSIPWVIPVEEATVPTRQLLPSDGRVGYAITKAGHKMSADRVKVTGLSPGTYEVAIDGEIIGEWSHVQLGTKIELQENEKTPQYQQALQVALLNQKRNDELVRPMRDQAAAYVRLLRSKASGNEKREPKAVEKLEAQIEEAKNDLERLYTESESRLDEIYKSAQPVRRMWVLRKVK